MRNRVEKKLIKIAYENDVEIGLLRPIVTPRSKYIQPHIIIYSGNIISYFI